MAAVRLISAMRLTNKSPGPVSGSVLLVRDVLVLSEALLLPVFDDLFVVPLEEVSLDELLPGFAGVVVLLLSGLEVFEPLLD